MDVFEIVQAEVRAKRAKLENYEEEYRSSCHKWEECYDDLSEKRRDITYMIEEKYGIARHRLYQSAGDRTEDLHKLGQIASQYSEMMDINFKRQQTILEREKAQLDQEYKKKHHLLEADLEESYRKYQQLK
ncbi:hypothetical protein D8827_04315 [Streptococcus intermedius]|jgi:hypothetical protein|uniref:Uncharacterized protein n=1 Tax=Streptococcus intermedius TaxID=1338 RepID=A0AAE8G3T6_STRIT|nr:hypothetical protein [Streptococcus intermedius]RSJ18732.1 hypothetical protein D8829_09475 [Streptococcus intermedius]RSJ23740.1 hypothetical protein D8827_04315 [Streptococcus intermedius]RSJ25836.1 hypothetical protein D8826_06700 [Streptococcus intermedius]